MRIIMLYICLLGNLFPLFAQNQKLLIFEDKKIDASIPFYTIYRMSCRLGLEQIVPEREMYTYEDTEINTSFKLSTRDKFSIFDAKISAETQNNTALTKQFNVYVYQENLPRNWNAVSFHIYLQEKDWEVQKATMRQNIEAELQKKFPSYQLKIELSSKTKYKKTTLHLKVYSYTGDDEFETTSAKKERCKKMLAEITPSLKQLINKYHKQRIRKLQREVIEPYRRIIKSQRQAQKLHTLKFDIQSLGKYSSDKAQFYDVKCSDNWTLEHLGVPIEQAKLLRASPTEYQLRGYVFEGQMSVPWSPNRDPSAFGFYEIIHKPTNKLIARTYARFDVSPLQYFYNFMITFPRY